MDYPTVSDLLAQYEADRDSLGPTGRSVLIRLLAAAWRAKTDEMEDVRRGSQVVIHELQSQVRNYTKALAEARAEIDRLTGLALEHCALCDVEACTQRQS